MQAMVEKASGGPRDAAMAALFAIASVSCANADNHGVGASAAEGYTLVDDMEGADGRIAWAPPGGWPLGQRPGLWSSSTDCSETSRILPQPYFVDPHGWAYDSVRAYPTMPGVTSAH